MPPVVHGAVAPVVAQLNPGRGGEGAEPGGGEVGHRGAAEPKRVHAGGFAVKCAAE